jgi:arylsulfatase A-like enzyme
MGVVCAGLGSCVSIQRLPQRQRKPNIILVVADELGCHDLGCYGHPAMHTPNLNRMAKQGLRFTRFYGASAQDAPARCCLMTGVHTGHARITSNDRGPLLPSDSTLGKIIKRAGYMTGCIGRWEVGDHALKNDPWNNGFDYFFGQLSRDHGSKPYPQVLWRNGNGSKNSLVRAEEINRNDYTPDLFTHDAVTFIENHVDQPFFLYLPFSVSHSSCDLGTAANLPGYHRYQNKPWTEQRKMHAAMLTHLDRSMGRILKTLGKLHLDQDTVVMFTSVRPGSQEPLRAQQRGHEGDLRVPFVVRWPGKIKSGRVAHTPCVSWDILPTVARLSGSTQTPGTDGVSLLPTLLELPEQKTQSRYLYWQHDHQGELYRAVRLGPWKGVRIGQDRHLALYHLINDPAEETDVSDRFPEVVADIEQLFAEAQQPLGETQ